MNSTIQEINLKDYDESFWIGFFITEIFLISVGICVNLILWIKICNNKYCIDEEEKKVSTEEKKVSTEEKKESTEEKKESTEVKKVSTEKVITTNDVKIEFTQIEETNTNKKCCLFKYLSCDCIPEKAKDIICLSLIILLSGLSDLYTMISENFVIKTRFEGSQYIIYNNSQIINSKFLVYDQNWTENFLKENKHIAYSSIGKHTNISINNTFNSSNCHSYDYQQIQHITTIYHYLAASYTLLIINSMTEPFIIVYNLGEKMSQKLRKLKWWKKLLILFLLKAIESDKLRFSFFSLILHA